jgi:molybdopterin converting factor small subunit
MTHEKPAERRCEFTLLSSGLILSQYHFHDVNYTKITRSSSSEARVEVRLLLVRVRVAYFALARDLAGKSEEEFTFDSTVDTEQLFSAVLNAHPRLREIREIMRTVVNGRVVMGNAELKDADHVALLPAVGGG